MGVMTFSNCSETTKFLACDCLSESDQLATPLAGSVCFSHILYDFRVYILSLSMISIINER